jgi:ribosomal protein L11 methyltransferase
VDLQQLSIQLDRESALHAEALLSLAGALALSLDDAADAPLFEPAVGAMPLWPSVRLRALFNAEVNMSAVAAIVRNGVGSGAKIEIATLVKSDWSAGLQQTISPRRFGEKLFVVPADTATADAPTTIRLNMGLAFGTGQHPTTALCLEWLDAHPPRGATVYDYGCGSGVLAIAALKLGAAFAWGSDLDPQAATATRANAVLNAVEDSIWVGTPAELPPISPDIVLANILAGTLIESTDLLAKLLAPGRKLVLSGILNEQRDLVTRAFAADFGEFEFAELGGWIRIVATRNAGTQTSD